MPQGTTELTTVEDHRVRWQTIQNLLASRILFTRVDMCILGVKSSPKNRPFDAAHAAKLSQSMEAATLDPTKSPAVLEFKDLEAEHAWAARNLHLSEGEKKVPFPDEVSQYHQETLIKTLV